MPKNKKIKSPSTIELGCVGVKHQSGYVREEPLKQLRELANRTRVYDEMSQNDAVIAGNINSFESLIMKSNWKIKPFSKKPRHKKEAEFAQKCVFEMENSFSSILYDAISCMIYGFSDLEIVYEKDDDTGWFKWKDLSPRPQNTIYKWDIDKNGKFIGLQQKNPNDFVITAIPKEKLLHFAPLARKRNPEGKSLLRSAYLCWYYKKKIEELEVQGVEKDIRGTPIAKAPNEFLNSDDPDMKDIQNQLKQLVTELSRSQDTGIVFPSDEGWTIELLKGQGNSLIADTNPLVDRHSRNICISMLSDFIMLGKGATGGLAQVKVKTLASFVTSLMDNIQDVFNDGLKRLWIINGLNPDERPKLIHTNLEELESMTVALILQSAHKLGLITPSADLENWIRENHLKGAPLVTDEEWQEGRDRQLQDQIAVKEAGMSKSEPNKTNKD